MASTLWHVPSFICSKQPMQTSSKQGWCLCNFRAAGYHAASTHGSARAPSCTHTERFYGVVLYVSPCVKAANHQLCSHSGVSAGSCFASSYFKHELNHRKVYWCVLVWSECVWYHDDNIIWSKDTYSTWIIKVNQISKVGFHFQDLQKI